MGTTMNAWLKQRGLWRSATDGGDKGIVTHVFLNGGKASVERAEDREAFLRVYASDVVAGRPLYAVERTVGASYRMFVDLDLPTDRGDHRMILEIVRVALSRAPAELRVGEVSVCTRSAHEGKIGAHLVWSDLVRVDDERAMALRNAWVDALTLGEPTLDEQQQQQEQQQKQQQQKVVDWDKTLDASVYRRNGLRMPWSLKRGGSQLAAYVPTHVASWRDSRLEIDRWEDDAHDLLEDDIYARLVRCSIAASDWDDARNSDPKKRKRSESCTGSSSGKSKASKGSDNIELSSEEREAIRDALPRDLYGDCEVGLRCFRWTRGESTGLSVSSTSRHCQAEGRAHRSNHVFFELFKKKGTGKNGIVVVHQRCHKCAEACVETRILDPSAMSAVSAILEERCGSNDTRNKKMKKKKPCPSLFPASAATAAGYWLAKMTATPAESSA